MSDTSPPPPETEAPPVPPSSSGSPTDFLKGVVGKRVIVRLASGVDYRGVLSCLDGYMNIALEQTEEHVNGVVTNRYGDAFIRGNNDVDVAFGVPTGSAKALLQAFSMIIVSEIGDKTFLIAAILAMRHPRLTVFFGAWFSLVLMSLLSAALGHILPVLVPRTYTQLLAGALFLAFGTKMLMEARAMEAGNGKIQEEMREAEEEIEEDEEDEKRVSIPMRSIEEGHASEEEPEAMTKAGKATIKEGLRNFCSLFFGPVFVQAFILTFLGEWGDRSQISTIALGAAHNMYLVAFGTIVGHSACTVIAVLGGRYLSTKISVKHVTFGGSLLFLLFGLIYLYEALATSSDVEMSIPLSLDDQAIPPVGLL
ncbi:hypothetical protein C0992_001938 [Termitomyces sp. T32_za158]|nr:hypothetical protein C0992_001938 [Termitomyces sp. T32_za158]